jgi:hypothetical protein
MDEVDAKTGAGVLGVGAVACAACCAGPVLGLLAGVGLTAALGAVLFGVVGLAVALVVGVVLWRRRQARRCQPPEPSASSEPVAVEPPRLRSGS